jgi:hypothetical protein
VSISIRGLSGLEAAFTRGAAQADLAARSVVQVGALELVKEAQANFSGSHRKGQPHIPNGNNFPNVVSGTLRRSIQSDGVRAFGPAAYSTRVGPSTVYGRRVELGLAPTGPHPYFGPAVKRMRPKLAASAVTAWSKIRF